MMGMTVSEQREFEIAKATAAMVEAILEERKRLLEDIDRYREDIQRLRERLNLAAFPPISQPNEARMLATNIYGTEGRN